MTIQGQVRKHPTPSLAVADIRTAPITKAQGYAFVFGKAAPFTPRRCERHGLPFIESDRSTRCGAIRCGRIAENHRVKCRFEKTAWTADMSHLRYTARSQEAKNGNPWVQEEHYEKPYTEIFA